MATNSTFPLRVERSPILLRPSILIRVKLSAQDIAVEVIRQSSREKPADAVLREVLKGKRGLPPFTTKEVSMLVFLHYRWLGWTRGERNLEAKLRLARRLDERFRTTPASFKTAELSANVVPEWTAAELDLSEDWLRSLQSEPRLWLRAKRGQAAVVAAKLRLAGTLAPPSVPDALAYEGEEDLFKTPEFHAGEFEIQDIASQAVGLLCDPKPGETWWDACAGEGGKTLHLSELMQNKGLIWASDRANWRLEKLKRRAARAKVFNYRCATWDGGAKLPTKTKFDGVLVDAPCSGLGTWQRNPHARWTTSPDDVRELAEVQARLLANVASLVKPGGKLIYSVCTLTRSETDAVVSRFNQTQSEFRLLCLPALPPGESESRALTSAATLTIWPHQFGGNGMFVAAWRRGG